MQLMLKMKMDVQIAESKQAQLHVDDVYLWDRSWWAVTPAARPAPCLRRGHTALTGQPENLKHLDTAIGPE